MPEILILIDIQRDYFPGGRFPLVGSEPAGERAAKLLEAFRARALPVIHIRHESLGPDAGFLAPGTDGVDFFPAVAPHSDEVVITKHHPNGFLETDLQAHIDRHPGSTLVVAGMMTSMCVDATVRAASDLGYTVQVAGDACAAPDLVFGGTRVAGADVQAAFLAALGSAYARVATVDELIATPGFGAR